MDWDWVHLSGYIGSGLNVVAFFMRVPIRLRQIAIVSSILLAIFGFEAHVWGTFVASAILVPLNTWRLRELYATRDALRSALASTDLSWDWVRPFMTRRHFGAGATIFRKGDLADEIYFILDGTVRFEEFAVEVGIGTLFGEIAMFSPGRRRTATATSLTATTMLALTSEQLIELYEKNPQFGIYLVRTIVARLIDDIEVARSSRGGGGTHAVASPGDHSGAIAP